MSAAPMLFTHAQELPGWFGKLPGMGDFAHRRLPDAFRERWDHWLQHGLMQLRQQHPDWTERYLQSPLWFFVLAPGVMGPQAWVGVLMPSVDGVGRYFPFAVARELALPLAQIDAQRWFALMGEWQHAAHCALQALDQDLDAAGVDALLAAPPAPVPAGQHPAPPPTWPEDGQSLWLTDLADARAPRLRAAGLPRSLRFEHLFGFDDAADALPLP